MSNYPENDYRNYLEHSQKGSTWKDHKYIDIINGRYIYPATQAVKSAGRYAKGLANAVKTGGLKGADQYVTKKNYEKQKSNRVKNLYEARQDIGKKWAKNRKKEETGGTRAAVGGAITRTKSALASLKPKNINRNVYRKTGKTVKGNASALYNRAMGILTNTKQNIKNTSRKAYRQTGKKGVVGLVQYGYENWNTNRKNKKKGKYASRKPR